MSIKTTLKTSVAAAALFAVAAPVVSSPAEAGLANGNDNSVVISGSLNRSLMYVDNGKANEWVHTDGGTDNSRLRILVNGQLTESIKVGGTWEANLPRSQDGGSVTSTSSSTNGSITTPADGAFQLRKTDIKFTHSTMGSLSIGKGDYSSNNKKGMGTPVSNNAGMSHGGGVFLYDKTSESQTALTAGGQFSSYFGSRNDRIRYDTPSIMGLQASASFGDEHYYDFGLNYGVTLGDTAIAASAQMSHSGGSGPTENAGASIAAKHASGISGSIHYGQEFGTRGSEVSSAVEGNAWGVEAGYTTKALNNLGATSFEIIYNTASETSTDNLEASSTQFHVTQAMSAGVGLYAAYEVADFDDTTNATSLEDVSVFLVGTRLKF